MSGRNIKTVSQKAMKNSQDYGNVVFDLGNVLVQLDSEGCMNAFSRLGLLPYLDPTKHPEGRRLMNQLGLGLITSEQFYDSVRQLSGLNVSDKQIEEAANKMVAGFPDAKKERLMELKQQGKRLFLLSNTIDIHWDYCEKRLFSYKNGNVEELFDGVFLSQRMHMEKPNAEIFREVEKITGIDPDDTLYIDDLEANCLAAQKSVGWHVFQNKNFNDWLNIL